MFCFQCQETAKNTGCTIKGMCGKPEETANLQDLLLFMLEALTSTTKELTVDQMVALIMKAGGMAVTTMALLDEANTTTYGHPEITQVNIGGIPRVLDAGQCNDSYSLAVIALKLKEVFGLADINELPISFDIAWYEQKAVAVLLALLSLGIKGIRLGPTLPGFLSPGVAKVLIDTFNIKPISTVQEDIAAMMAGN